MLRGPAWAVVALGIAAARAAIAQPIVDRDYAIDHYDGVAIGNTAQIGMGGAGAALINGSAGALLNASAPAVRATTDNDAWSWDYHLDALTGRYSTDYDNNGQVLPAAGADGGTSGASLVTGGLAVRVGDWAGALTVTGQTAPVWGVAPALDAETLRSRFVIARWIRRWDLAIGIGAQTVLFQLGPPVGAPLFAMSGGGGLAGATWVPGGRSYRAALAWESSILGGDVQTSTCDPEDCAGYILPRQIVSSARLVAGGAYRLAATPWNQLVPTTFRDERALTVAADVVVTGPAPNGHGIEAFGMQQLQRSGRHAAVSLRGGAELEWLPGRLRVRAGSYWEPARFDDVPGRLHATFGADLRVFEFRAWGLRRGRLSATGDVAARYRNIAVSIGLWH